MRRITTKVCFAVSVCTVAACGSEKKSNSQGQAGTHSLAGSAGDTSDGSGGISGIAGTQSTLQGGTTSAGDGGAGGGAENGGLGGTTGEGGTAGSGTAGTLNQGGFAGNPNPTLATCADAAAVHANVGCEFWPTFVANPVWTDFEPGIVVANPGPTEAVVSVTGPAEFETSLVIPPGASETIPLNWVEELKGPEYSRTNTSGGRLKESARVDGGAYRVTSSVPVSVWQFNPLRTEGTCKEVGVCRSASNDASLLLPTSALTGNYRVFAYSTLDGGQTWGTVPGAFAVTATVDNTQVKIQLALKCGSGTWNPPQIGDCVAAGDGIEAKKADETYAFTLNAGDVVQLVGQWGSGFSLANADVSGAIINATQPVQVISFNSIAQVPDDSIANSDHMEETIFPAETLGRKYIVVPPTTTTGKTAGHVVRIYGNVDGTKLSYPLGKPAGAPDTVMAGDVVEIPPKPTNATCKDSGKCVLTTPFVVEADQPFAVASFMPGGAVQMPGTDPVLSKGDPAMTFVVPVEQFRNEYTFAAHSEYSDHFVEIVAAHDADVMLDGVALSAGRQRIGTSEWALFRVKLDNDLSNVHKLTTAHSRGLGVQLSGFAFATAYYQPAGMNLKRISQPPIIAP